jgi:hypothetical protein
MPRYSIVGQQDGTCKMVESGNAGAGERDEVALLGRRSGLLNRRSFLLGSAAGVGALGSPAA